MAFKKALANENAKIATVEPIRSKEDLLNIRRWFILNGFKKYEVLFMFGCYTGLRGGDIVGLKVGDVYRDGKILNQIEMREQKTAKIKRFPINPHLAKLLLDWCKGKDEEDYLFEGKQPGTPIDKSQVYRMIVKVCEELNINVNVGTHSMRKTFGYHHYKQFKDVALLQDIFNHTAPDVTKRYIGISQDEINQSYMALNLEEEDDSLLGKAKRIKGNNRKRITAILNFIESYLTATVNKGIHADFCEAILQISIYNEEYLEKVDEQLKKANIHEKIDMLMKRKDVPLETLNQIYAKLESI